MRYSRWATASGLPSPVSRCEFCIGSNAWHEENQRLRSGGARWMRGEEHGAIKPLLAVPSVFFIKGNSNLQCDCSLFERDEVQIVWEIVLN